MIKNTNNLGFSAVVALLIIAVLGMVGFTGWYVIKAKNDYDKNVAGNNSTSPAITSKKKSDKAAAQSSGDKEADAWQLATSRQGGFSIRIPDGWEVANYGGSDNIRTNTITYKAGMPAKIGNFNSPYAGDGLVRFQAIQFKDSDNFKWLDGDETKSAFEAGDLKGTRYYKQYPLEPLQGIGPIPGEETYTYEFKTTGKTTYVTYRILNLNQYSKDFLNNNYHQTSSDPNQLQLIERAVKTLKIN